MKNRKISTWAQTQFEKKSGWKAAQVNRRIREFSSLNGWNRVLYGGLLVGSLLKRSTSRSLRSPSDLKTR